MLFSTQTTAALVAEVCGLVAKNFYDSLSEDVSKALPLCAPYTVNMHNVIDTVGKVRSDGLPGLLSFAKKIAGKAQVNLNSLLWNLSFVDSQHREEFCRQIDVFLKNVNRNHCVSFADAFGDPSNAFLSINSFARATPDKWPHLSEVVPQIWHAAAPREHFGILCRLLEIPTNCLPAVRDLLLLFPTEITAARVADICKRVATVFYDALTDDVDSALQLCSPSIVELETLIETVARVHADDLPGFILFAKKVASEAHVDLNCLLLSLSGVGHQHRDGFYAQLAVFLKNKDVNDRWQVLHDFGKLPDSQRGDIIAVLNPYVNDDPFSISPSARLIRGVCDLAAAQGCTRATADFQFALQLVPMSTLEEDPQVLLRALNQVADADRASFLQLCQPLFAMRDRGQLIEHLSSVCQTPASTRAAHVYSLLNCNTDTEGSVNTENVMESRRIQQTRASILALLNRFDLPIARDAHLNAMEQYIINYPLGDIPQSEKDVFFAQRGGATERDNALRTLSAPRRDGDYSNCLRDNDEFSLGDREIGLGDLAALINHAIEVFASPGQSPAENAKEQALMRYGLFTALAQCIEDDGHRVCGVGLSQRLVSVLQGRYPQVHIDGALLPAQFVTIATRDFAALVGPRVPSPNEVQQFYAATMQRSRHPSHGFSAPEVASVETHLREYLSMTYGWPPPGQGA